MTTVNFGTWAHDTAVTSFAPSLAMPPASYSRPTMKPVMFCRKTSGTRRSQASSMKWAPFSADSENRMPLHACEPADQGVAVERLELVQHGAVDDPRDHLADVERLAQVAGDDAI